VIDFLQEDAAETEPEDFEPSSRWTDELFEPENPIINTDYTMNDYDAVSEMLAAVAYFEPVIVTYPYAYREASEDTEAYFDPDTANGLELYLSYRLVNTGAEQH